MNDILYAVEDQQQHQPLPAPVPSSSSRNQLITSSHNHVEEYSHPYNTHTATAQSQQQKQAAPPAIAQAASDVQLDQLLGPESQADVDDIVKYFTAADVLEVFEEFAYGVPESLQDTSAAEAGYHDSSPPTVPSSLKAVAAAEAAVADESPKGVNATLDPSVFDKFPRNTSLISLSPSPDQIHSVKNSSTESSPDPYTYHHGLTAPIVSDVDSNHSSFADPASYAFAPPGGPTLSNGGPNPYNLDIMDDLTSAAAAIEQQDALGADGSAASATPASASRGKGTPKKKANKKSAANDTAPTSAEARFKPFHEEKWDQKLTELIEFRAANGHTLVPHTYDPNPQLARWVKRQRRQYKLMQTGKTSTMTPERVAILEEAGFVWDSHEVSWREKVQELVQYREKHGDCLVPSSYRDNPRLATW